MKLEEDAYGQEMWAHYNGRKSFEIIERDDDYFDVAGTKIYFSKYEDWPASEKKAMQFVKGKVLDVGCGAGRHSLYLQEKGFDVLGIDSSPLAVKICKLRGLEKAEVMAIEELQFKPDSFDTILMLGNNFGLLGNFEKAQRLLMKFHIMTSKNALIIAGACDPYKTDNPAHLKYQERNKKERRMGGQLRLRIRFQQYISEWFDFLMVSKEEMKELLEDSGWIVRKFIDSKDMNYYITAIEKRALFF